MNDLLVGDMPVNFPPVPGKPPAPKQRPHHRAKQRHGQENREEDAVGFVHFSSGQIQFNSD